MVMESAVKSYNLPLIEDVCDSNICNVYMNYANMI